MRNFFYPIALVCCVFFGKVTKAQQPLNQINIITFVVKNKLPANIDTWGTVPGSIVLVAQKMPQVNIKGAKLFVQIKQNGVKICGSVPQNVPLIDSFTVRNFTSSEIIGYLSQCPILKAGNYQLCAQFLNIDRYPISKEVCKEFVVEDAIQVQQSYSPPQNISPANDKKFIETEAKLPITFRWTPIVPKPKDAVTYRLKVWQLMQGQTGAQAMRSNQPFIEKEVNNINQVAISNMYTGLCKPPYLCDFVWSVQALNKEGKPIGNNDGKSEGTIFKVLTQYIIQLDSLKVNCTAVAGKYSFSYIITNLNNTVAELVSVQVQSSTPGGATITSFAPPIGSTIAAFGGTLTVTGIITASPLLSNICIKTKIQKQGDSGKNAEDYLCENVQPCACDACDQKNFLLTATPPTLINYSSNTLNFNQPITITTSKIIKTVKTELVYFEMIPENNFCLPCNKDATTYGHFVNGTNSMEFVNNSNNQNLSFNISTPQLTPCCNAVFKYCIRYKIEFTDCTTCNKLVCYEKKKIGCENNTNTPK